MENEKDVDQWVGSRLRDLRSQRNLTLATLAEQTGISASHLSRIEKGDRQPSIGGLMQLARVYGLSLSELVEEQDQQSVHVVRAADVVAHNTGNGVFTVLSGPHAALSAARIELAAGKTTKPAQHDGEEWLHVVSGAIELRIGEQALAVAGGDSVHFDSARSHRLTTTGDRPATVLIVSTASTTPMHHPIPTRENA